MNDILKNPVWDGNSSSGKINYWLTPSRRKNAWGEPVLVVSSRTKTMYDGDTFKARLEMPGKATKLVLDADLMDVFFDELSSGPVSITDRFHHWSSRDMYKLQAILDMRK